jgi:hypothetical protein
MGVGPATGRPNSESAGAGLLGGTPVVNEKATRQRKSWVPDLDSNIDSRLGRILVLKLRRRICLTQIRWHRKNLFALTCISNGRLVRGV